MRHPIPLGTTTVPRPPQTSALGASGEKMAADIRLDEQQAWRGAFLGTGRTLLVNGAVPRERRDFPTLPEPFPPQVRRYTNFNVIIYQVHTSYKIGRPHTKFKI